MALQITKDKNGKPISYWRIVKLYYNEDETDLMCELRGYENKAKSDQAQTGAKTAEYELKFSFSGQDFPNVNAANLKKSVYALIKKSKLYDLDWSKASEV